MVTFFSENAKLHTSKKTGRKSLVPSLQNTSSTFDIRTNPMKLISKYLVEDDELGVGKIVYYENNKWKVQYKTGGNNCKNYNAVDMLERLEKFMISYGSINYQH